MGEDRWQPIYTAPKDGSFVDLWCINHLRWDKRGERLCDRRWIPCIDWMGVEREDWNVSRDFEPTHWMPRPTAPTLPADAKENGDA